MAKQNNSFQELSTEELLSSVAAKQAELQQMRISHGLNLLDRPSSLKMVRREIARLLTAINARAKSAQ
jgi:ribosomal protein L29